MTTREDDNTASLRSLLRQALSAYELAVAAHLRTQREATEFHRQRMASIAAQEHSVHKQREHDHQQEQRAAAPEAARAEILAELVGKVQEAATSLLERASLAYVRGFSSGSVGAVQPHMATDEQAAAAFAAAQTAAVDLRAALLKLARVHLEDGRWEQARNLLISLQSEAAGALGEEAAGLLYSTYLGEATSAAGHGEWQKAQQLEDLALKLFPDERTTDPGRVESLLRAMFELAEQPQSANRLVDAAPALNAIVKRVGSNHPAIHRWARSHVPLAWASGVGTCFQEFGGHSLPVQDVKFTADGQRVVSVDGAHIKIWRNSGTGSSELLTTIPVPEVYKLSDDGLLTISADGKLLKTSDGALVCQLSGAKPMNIAAFAYAQDAPLVAWASREETISRDVTFRGEDYESALPSDFDNAIGYVPASRSDFGFLAPLNFAQGISRWTLRGAILKRKEWKEQKAGDAYAVRYWLAGIRRVELISIANSRTGKTTRTIPLESLPLVLSIALSSKAEFVAWLLPEGEAVVTDIASGIVRYTFRLEPEPARTTYNSISFSPRDDLIMVATVHHDGYPSGWQSTIRAWGVTTGDKAWRWDTRGKVGALALSPDGRLIAAMNTEGSIALYDIWARSSLPAIGNHGKVDFPCLAFSPDGSRLVTAGDQTVKVWGVA